MNEEEPRPGSIVPFPAIPPKTYLHVVDRSRYTTGLGKCMRKRYLEYHSGEGYGLRKKRESLPLVTGSSVHKVLADILQQTLDDFDKVTDEFIRERIKAEVTAYDQLVSATGLTELEAMSGVDEGDSQLQQIIAEQKSLIEGMIWGWMRVVYPGLIVRYDIIAVEREFSRVIGCTCGLGNNIGQVEDHETRSCDGILLMTKPDLILRDKQSGLYTYVEWKTTGWGFRNWEEQHGKGIQAVLGCLGAEHVLGVEVTQFIVGGLMKGKRDKDWDPEQQSTAGPKWQHSVFCYAYYKPGNPPMYEAEWATSKYYTCYEPHVQKWGKGHRNCPGGKNHRRGDEWKRVPIWEGGMAGDPLKLELAEPVQAGAEFPEKPEYMSNAEYWAKWVPIEEIEGLFKLVGPFQLQRELAGDVIRQIEWQERRVKVGLWEIEDALNQPELDDALDTYFPPSWNCWTYNRMCEFAPFCYKEGDLENRFVPRKPHHQPEIVQLVGRGFKLPDLDVAESEEEGA